jgi:hypothetical protein
MRLIWAVALCLAVEPAFAQSYTSDQIAGSLGFMMGMASLCARPTASLEAELELYIRKAGAGPWKPIGCAARRSAVAPIFVA